MRRQHNTTQHNTTQHNTTQHNTARRTLRFEQLEDRRYMAVVISEFMANNNSFSNVGDWIEVYNSGPSAVDISGWELDDGDPNNFYRFPPGTVLADKASIVRNSQQHFTNWGLSTNRRLEPGTHDSVRLIDNANQVQQVQYPEQVTDASYGIIPGTENNPQYKFYESPTPGQRNGNLTFSHQSGIYHQAFQLSLGTLPLATGSPALTIRYTVDGKMPTNSHGSVYNNNPINISVSTTVRVAVISQGEVVESALRTYLFENSLVTAVDAANGPGTLTVEQQTKLKNSMKSLPGLIVNVLDRVFTDGDAGFINVPLGFSGTGVEVTSTVEWVENGQSKFQFTSNIQGHGNTCDAFGAVKPCYRLEFKELPAEMQDPNRSGIAKLPYDLFPGAASPGNDITLDDLVLRSGNQDSLPRSNTATYLRDSIGRETFRDMGGLAPHQRPVSLFMNGLYQGLYFVSERPSGDFISGYRAGNAEDYHVVRYTQENGLEALGVECTGNILPADCNAQTVNEWKRLFDVYVSPFLSNSGGNTVVAAGLYNSVASQIDMNNFVHFVLANHLTKHLEFQNGFNWVSSKKKSGVDLWQFHTWDVENWMSALDVTVPTPSANIVNGKLVTSKIHPVYLHSLLMGTTTYQYKVAERLRAHAMRGVVTKPNPLSLAGIYGRIASSLNEVNQSIDGEALRYGKNVADWNAAISAMTSPTSSISLPFQHRGELLLDYGARIPDGIAGLMDADLDNNGLLNAGDIDNFNQALLAGNPPAPTYDINGNGIVNSEDRIELVWFYIGTFFGDSNLDGIFNSSDFVQVYQSGEYDDGTNQNSTWVEGDWDGDLDFTTGDLTFAFNFGGYDPS